MALATGATTESPSDEAPAARQLIALLIWLASFDHTPAVELPTAVMALIRTTMIESQHDGVLDRGRTVFALQETQNARQN